jgi:hypothetical protein
MKKVLCNHAHSDAVEKQLYCQNIRFGVTRHNSFQLSRHSLMRQSALKHCTRQTFRDHLVGRMTLDQIPMEGLKAAQDQFRGIAVKELTNWANAFCKANRDEIAPNRCQHRGRVRLIGWFAQHQSAWDPKYDPRLNQATIEISIQTQLETCVFLDFTSDKPESGDGEEY